ncbi:SDR family oxidoreductase [Stieleria mannarensis]|uniref:SDR family oxidoreductase n=1 Tax=Stieleria mannarensis TaxID=2755585 RepID=UPI00256FA846|nr:SDR family oxidoreductase [Rhodopirellula sp. JC639]
MEVGEQPLSAVALSQRVLKTGEMMKRVLLAGSTGYLGSYIAKELQRRSHFVRTIARNQGKLKQLGVEADEVIEAQLTDPDSIKDCCRGIDVVITTVGITRQKDGLTYMDVDFQANMNLLDEAKRSGVEKFIYVSVLNGEKLRELKICDAKERFVDRLKQSGLDHCVIRPNGFFSDMSEFYRMAKRGRVYLFGDGELRANPIHGEDLARVCVDAIDKPVQVIEVGGPETFTQNQIASIAFESLGKRPAIVHLPDWIRVLILKLVRRFTGSKVHGPIEFFMTVMAMDMLAPENGTHTLEEYFAGLDKENGSATTS